MNVTDRATSVLMVMFALSLSTSMRVSAEVVDQPGTVTVTPGVKATALTNLCATGTVTFDASASSATEANAIVYTGFEAPVDSAISVFKGGWWNFSAGAFLSTTNSSRQVSLEGGAILKNLGAIKLSGTGTNNQLSLKGASGLYATSLTLGEKKDEQHNDVTVTDGSTLALSGDLTMSAGTDKYYATKRTRNVVTVAGAGTTLTVGGATYLSTKDGYNGSTGGNSLYVTNGATASLGDLYLTQGLFYGGDDQAYFADNVCVTTRSIHICDSWSSADDRASKMTRLTIGAGAVVTNTDTFTMGMTGSGRVSRDPMELVISNGTFHTAKLQTGAVSTLLIGPCATLRISGKDAKATFNYTGSFATFCQPDCELIVENGATWNIPSANFSYTAITHHETVRVRTGATFNCANGLATTSTGTAEYKMQSHHNAIVVESDAKLISASALTISGTNSELIVDNGTVQAAYSLWVGDLIQGGHSCTCTLRGSHPIVRSGYNLSCGSNSCFRIELPASGYDEGYATSTNPMVTFVASGSTFIMDPTGRMEITGVAELQAYHRQADTRREYVLISAQKELDIPSDMLSVLQAQVATVNGASLITRKVKVADIGDRYELVLKMRSGRGLSLLVR